jgi:geranylgeranyl pyrophosphate synthase
VDGRIINKLDVPVVMLGGRHILGRIAMYSQINDYLRKHETFMDWARLQEFFISIINEKPNQIKIPILIAEVFGANNEQRVVVGTCLALIYAAIVALDDLLDEDLRYVTADRSASQLANMSAGLIGLAFQIGEELSPDLSIAKQAHTILSKLIFNVSFGQALDTTNLDSEEAYWRVARLKSGAFFSGAFSLGGVVGEASLKDLERLAFLGEEYGIMLQIHDDLKDALAVPANPDWLNGRFTLPILFAHLVNHPKQERFDQIRSKVNDPDLLREAQEILIRSGALSYGLYQIQEHYRTIQKEIVLLSLQVKSVVEKIFRELIQPVEQLLYDLTSEEMSVIS